jgi:hypothetical protein
MNTVHSIRVTEQADDGRPAARSRAGRLSGRRGRALLALGSVAAVVLALVAAESVARLWEPDYLARTRGLHVFSSTLGWTPRKGTSVVVEGRRFSFDADGHRAPRRPRQAGAGTRVVVLGDSIAFGLDVSDEETFSSVMDARDNGIEVLNLAVQGYGPGQELMLLLADGLGHSPDVVVLAFCLSNDFADAVLPVSLYDGRTPKPRFGFAGDRLVLDDSSLLRSAAQRTVQWLGDHSHLFNRLGGSLERAQPPSEVHWHARKREALQDEGNVLRLALALVGRMDEECRRRGIPFLVAAFPSRATYAARSWFVGRFLEELEAREIAVVDMAAGFRERGLGPDAVQIDDLGHLSPLGHAVAGEILEAEVARVSGERHGAPAAPPPTSAP